MLWLNDAINYYVIINTKTIYSHLQVNLSSYDYKTFLWSFHMLLLELSSLDQLISNTN